MVSIPGSVIFILHLFHPFIATVIMSQSVLLLQKLPNPRAAQDSRFGLNERVAYIQHPSCPAGTFLLQLVYEITKKDFSAPSKIYYTHKH
jgi:hypothetical protein